MQMEVLRTKSPEMARKEVSMCIIAYNCLIRLMLQASKRHRVSLWRLSFKGALQVLDTWAGRFCGGRLRAKQEAQRVEELLEQLAARVVPRAPARTAGTACGQTRAKILPALHQTGEQVPQNPAQEPVSGAQDALRSSPCHSCQAHYG